MGCNSSTHTSVEDTAHANSKSDCNGPSTTGSDVEKAENDLECAAQAASESSEGPVTSSESNTLHTATEPTPAGHQEAGAATAGQSEQTGPEEAAGPSEEH